MATYSSIKYDFTPPIATTSAQVGGGAMVLIKSIDISSDATINFVDGASSVVLDNTYKTYIFKFYDIHPQTNDADTKIYASIDGGSNYNVTVTSGFFQAYHAEGDSTATLGYLTSKDVAQVTSGAPIEHSVGSDSDQSSAGELWLFNPSSTTFIKHFISRMNISHAVDNSQDIFVGGYFNTTSAVDAIRFQKDTGNLDAGTIKLYGIA